MSVIGYKAKKQKVGVIIQARMTSTRFPGKSMALLNGKPVLRHVIENSLKIRPQDMCIVAVPDTEASEPMLELVEQMGNDVDAIMQDRAAPIKLTNFCGSETDVLDRYYQAAKHFGFDIIMRITADCPFIVPRVCSEVLQLLLWRKLDYCSNCYPFRSFPKGLDCEAFTFDFLEAAHQFSTSPEEREHVTLWMHKMCEVECNKVKKAYVQQQIDASHVNWCVDYPQDIERLEEIIKAKTIAEASSNDNK